MEYSIVVSGDITVFVPIFQILKQLFL